MTIKQEDFKWSSLLRSEHYLQPCPKMCGHPSAVIFQLIIPPTHLHLTPMKELPAVDGQKCLDFITLILSQCADSFASVSHQHEKWDAESALWLWLCLTTPLSFPPLLLPPSCHKYVDTTFGQHQAPLCCTTGTARVSQYTLGLRSDRSLCRDLGEQYSKLQRQARQGRGWWAEEEYDVCSTPPAPGE